MASKQEGGFWSGVLFAVLMAACGLVVAGLRCVADEPPAPGGVERGRELFLSSHCNSCHTVRALGIGVEEEEAEEAEEGEEGEEEEEGEVEPPDLSDVGTRRDAAWITRWLRKEERIDGRKHMKKFRASAEDTAALAEWVAGLRHAAPPEGGGEGEQPGNE